MRKFTADFETNVDESDCRIWAYSICEIGNTDNFIYGNNMKDFIDWCANKNENYIVYFHNLKFDLEYILSYILKEGYRCIKDKKEKEDKTFTTLISDMGQFYSCEIYFETHKKHVNKVTFYDSLKILNFSVDKIAKDFNLPIRKLKIDYKEKREIGHILTKQEIDYIRNDVEIMARALKIMFDENLTKMTIGSDALANYKEINTNFNKYFPKLPYEIDKDIRQSYKGGFTYLNDCYKEKTTGEGIVFDYNSLYPAILVNEVLPYGEPIFFDGQYESDVLYKLYIQTFTCSFELKEGMIPTIQIRNNPCYLPNEYVKSSDGEPITLTLTNIDLDLFFEHYNITSKIIYHSGWKFKGIKGLFTNYINYWSDRKIQAKKEHNKSIYLISKVMMNSLYGKMGLNPDVRSKYPYLDDDEIVRYKMYEPEIRDSIYLPIATFVTSYGRSMIVNASQKIRNYSIEVYGVDKYVYSDTDSIHCLFKDEKELINILDIDDYRLGALKLESRFRKGQYIRQKCYIEEQYITEDEYNEIKENNPNANIYKIDENYYVLSTTIAGLPKELSKTINFDNFKVGFTTEGMNIDKKKLTYKHVKGGVMLVDTDFTIK